VTAVLTAPVADVESSHGSSTTVLLHILPGALALLAYVELLPLAAALGLPSVAALAGAGLLIAPSVQLGVLLVHRRQRPSEPAVALRVRLPLLRMLGWAVLEIVLAGVAFVVTAPAHAVDPDACVRVVARGVDHPTGY